MVDTPLIEYLVDAGALVSAIRDDIHRGLRNVVMLYERCMLCGGNGQRTQALAQCTCRTESSSKCFPVEFAIFSSRTHHVILDRDVLFAINAVIDCAQGRFLFSCFPLSETTTFAMRAAVFLGRLCYSYHYLSDRKGATQQHANR